MTIAWLNYAATFCFAMAILHTFLVKRFQHLAGKFPSKSIWDNFFHLMGEIEVVFGIWSAVYLVILGFAQGGRAVTQYLESLRFTEPAFVFAIMIVCSTRPILRLAEKIILLLSGLLPLKGSLAFYLATLVVGPLLGSFITEPAAMTVTALLLLRYFYHRKISTKLMYATLGLLFVNVSIGGTLTPFAAPPILMVAGKWNWDFSFMMGNFGWKGALACGLSASLVAFRFRQELSRLKLPKDDIESRGTPLGVTLLHVLFLVLIVASAHEMVVFIGLLFFFIGLVNVTRSYQNELLLRNGLLVAFFLGGLVVLGTPQSWWLEKVLTSIDSWALYLGAMGLTAFTDNAALTYLGAQVPALTDASRYALVAGSVVGGGLTVIANAPNPAGYGILDETFGKEGISPLGLFLSAVPPTLIAALCFWFL
jgi:hypothetical protein